MEFGEECSAWSAGDPELQLCLWVPLLTLLTAVCVGVYVRVGILAGRARRQILDQRSSVAGRPPPVKGQTPAVQGQVTENAQPAAISSQPAASSGQPAVAPGQPAVASRQPAVAPGRTEWKVTVSLLQVIGVYVSTNIGKCHSRRVTHV